MDVMTKFRTRQMLCVLCFDSNMSNNVVGVIQIINCKAYERPDSAGAPTLQEQEDPLSTKSDTPDENNDIGVDQVAFSKEDEMFATVIARQLGSIIHNFQSRPTTKLSSTTIGGAYFSFRVEQLLIMMFNCDDPIAKRKDKKLFPSSVKVDAAMLHGHQCLGRSATTLKVESEPLELDELMKGELMRKQC